jgi:hypothetical protein
MARGHKHTPETLAKIGEASRRRMAAQGHDADPKPPDDFVDGDMTPDDLIFVLEHLPFRDRGALVPLRLDKHARDYILTALRLRHQPAS